MRKLALNRRKASNSEDEDENNWLYIFFI
jgi:hypothetical protein